MIIKWGIVGLGNMANIFASSIHEAKNSKLVCVASNSNTKLESFAKKFNIKSSNKFSSYTKLIESDEIDAVYISTLNNTHLDLILECAKNNKKILCEKPIGLNFKQANLALEAVNKYNICFYEAFAYRSHPQTKSLLELIDSGEVGKIYKIEAYFGFKVRKIKKDSRLFNKELGGGAILDIGCYPVSFFNQFCKVNEHLKLINSKGTFSSTGVDDEAELEVLVGKDIEAYCKVSLKKNLNNFCKIYGRNGIINIPSPWLPSEKSYIEVIKKNSYYKKIIASKSIYAAQIESVANLFIKNSSKGKNMVNINESSEIMKILDLWKANLI